MELKTKRVRGLWRLFPEDVSISLPNRKRLCVCGNSRDSRDARVEKESRNSVGSHRHGSAEAVRALLAHRPCLSFPDVKIPKWLEWKVQGISLQSGVSRARPSAEQLAGRWWKALTQFLLTLWAPEPRSLDLSRSRISKRFQTSLSVPFMGKRFYLKNFKCAPIVSRPFRFPSQYRVSLTLERETRRSKNRFPSRMVL